MNLDRSLPSLQVRLFVILIIGWIALGCDGDEAGSDTSNQTSSPMQTMNGGTPMMSDMSIMSDMTQPDNPDSNHLVDQGVSSADMSSELMDEGISPSPTTDMDSTPPLPDYDGPRKKGIAIHHSGMLPVFRELIEIMFSKGYVELLFATEYV